MRVLYISYDGVMEPLGRSQVLQYLKRLAGQHGITLISYEKKADWIQKGRRHAIFEEMKAAGIKWYPLRYHKRPTAAATSYDIGAGILLGAFLVWRESIQILHSRSYVPSVIALALRALFKLKFVFDMRGFWADERVDGGLWAGGSLLYRIAKRFERRFLLAADRVVSLTHAAVEEMRRFPCLQGRMPRFEVITTCTDLDLFKRRESKPAAGPGARAFRMGYVGAVGLWYLFDEALDCFGGLREIEPRARLVILNRGEHAYILERLAHHRVPHECVELRAVEPEEVPAEMSAMDAGMFFLKPAHSKIASVPTKLGEFLGCGVPCLSNAGVGDVASVLEGESVGVSVRDFRRESLREGLHRLLVLVRDPETPRRCRETAERHFALEGGVRAYARIYEELGRESSGGGERSKDRVQPRG